MKLYEIIFYSSKLYFIQVKICPHSGHVCVHHFMENKTKKAQYIYKYLVHERIKIFPGPPAV